MISNPTYSLETALLADGITERYVIVDREDRIHDASRWLASMADNNRSPNTLKAYGARVAWYLSWTALNADWRAVTISHISLWRRVLSAPYVASRGSVRVRSGSTVNLWIVAVRSFYEWADAEGLMLNDLVQRMTHIKFYPAGTGGGGEHGARRRVLIDQLRSSRSAPPVTREWIDDSNARDRLLSIPLNARDRFFIDLLYYTGIRSGEALSMFVGDVHFGGGSVELDCNEVSAHFHVRVDNAVENGARAKGRARLLYVNDRVIDAYVLYISERERVLGPDDRSPHVFVNLYSSKLFSGRALRYSSVFEKFQRIAQTIGFEMTGPHVLRHTFATRHVRGIECDASALDVVQDMMGHASIDSTRIYSHDQEAAKRAAMQYVAPRRLDLESK